MSGCAFFVQRRIEADEIPEQDRQRPAVGDDAVQGQIVLDECPARSAPRAGRPVGR